jgi:hypothetical protein
MPALLTLAGLAWPMSNTRSGSAHRLNGVQCSDVEVSSFDSEPGVVIWVDELVLKKRTAVRSSPSPTRTYADVRHGKITL